MKAKFNELVTGIEIKQQPELWLETLDIIDGRLEEITKFIENMEKKNARVIFTGAGTSEFVGNSIVAQLNKDSKLKIESIATTDIVSNPELYLNKEETTLIVSCARSGNSPESVATVALADQLLDDVYHIFLTCNPEGKLAEYAVGKDNVLSILMPARSNDKGFAMTGSFTCMSLSGITIFNLAKLEEIRAKVEIISKTVENSFDSIYSLADTLSDLNTDRIVGLGDGTLKGLAQEATLKILELSSGNMATTFDSFLAFRHGPKSIVTDDTLIIAFMSNNNYTREYELDLLKEFKNESGNKKVVVIDNRVDGEVESNSDFYFTFNNENMAEGLDVFSNFGYIYIAQVYAFLKSLKYDINPDNPCPTGEVNRVVQGVILHKYQ
jgi:tagatose-6-phosphate ketose/aldose isomerase